MPLRKIPKTARKCTYLAPANCFCGTSGGGSFKMGAEITAPIHDLFASYAVAVDPAAHVLLLALFVSAVP